MSIGNFLLQTYPISICLLSPQLHWKNHGDVEEDVELLRMLASSRTHSKDVEISWFLTVIEPRFRTCLSEGLASVSAYVRTYAEIRFKSKSSSETSSCRKMLHSRTFENLHQVSFLFCFHAEFQNYCQYSVQTW